MVLARPESLLAIEWLRTPLARLLRDDRLDMLARTTGIDLRQVPELVLASYRSGANALVVRHRRKQIEIERKFRERLTSEVTRSTEGHQLIGLWGRIGLSLRGFAAIGRDVVLFQYGGDQRRGPARIALLYARGRLRSVPSAETLAAGEAPLKALLPGPFEGELARGARGLLAAAESVTATLAPSERRTLRLQVLLAGDYASHPDAKPFLEAAWSDLAKSDLGHLLGLHQPVAAPEVTVDASGLVLRAELDPEHLLRGLAAATVDNVREIMR